jgi:hypothetical protein
MGVSQPSLGVGRTTQQRQEREPDNRSETRGRKRLSKSGFRCSKHVFRLPELAFSWPLAVL